jgi:hypothetical protein
MAAADENSLGAFDYVIVGAGSAGCLCTQDKSFDRFDDVTMSPVLMHHRRAHD